MFRKLAEIFYGLFYSTIVKDIGGEVIFVENISNADGMNKFKLHNQNMRVSFSFFSL